MLVAGCLFLIVFPVIGFLVGLLIGGMQAAAWCALTGLLLALAMGGVLTYALVKAGRQR